MVNIVGHSSLVIVGHPGLLSHNSNGGLSHNSTKIRDYNYVKIRLKFFMDFGHLSVSHIFNLLTHKPLVNMMGCRH